MRIFPIEKECYGINLSFAISSQSQTYNLGYRLCFLRRLRLLPVLYFLMDVV